MGGSHKAYDTSLGKHSLSTAENLDFFRLIVIRWSDSVKRRLDWTPVFELVDYVLDILVREHCANELLCVAARAGCLPLIERMINKV